MDKQEIVDVIKEIKVPRMGPAIKEIKDKAVNVAVDVKSEVKKGFVDAKTDYKLKKYRPIYESEISNIEFRLPSMIRIVDEHDADPICKEAYGRHIDIVKGLPIVNVYRDCVEKFGIELLPNDIDEIYYKDPYVDDKYISLNSYFDYINEATYFELNEVAQDLGANHTEIYYEVEDKCFVSKKENLKAKKNSRESEEKSEKTKTITIDGGTDFEGHDNPVKPKLIYLKSEPAIKSLVEMRLNKNDLKSITLSIQSNNRAAINKTTAAKIDLALKKMNFEGNATIESQIEEDNRKHLKYKICF